MIKWLKKSLVRKSVMSVGFLSLFFVFVFSTASEEPENQIDEETRHCLSCHGSEKYEINDSITGDHAELRMYKELMVDVVKYQKGTHGAFKCTDCHSADFSIFPHPLSAKTESQYTCIDCHGGDEEYAEFHFETIEEEYNKSIHPEKAGEEGFDFSCWSCHNPHYYKLTSKEPGELKNRIIINNSVCLSCHGYTDSYDILIGKEIPDLMKNHDWLPNQTLHFSKVRCIDCHAANNDSILVAHMVLPSDKAVKKCVECHSTNSILWGSLYKHQAMTTRNELGFYNGIITNEAYIIGANRNYYLNMISIAIFILVIIGIAIHATLRYIHRHKKHAK